MSTNLANLMADSPQKSAQFIDLLTSNRNRLFGYLYSLVLNFDDAEDLYQQVAMVMWQKFHLYDPSRDFGRWAIRVAHLTVKDFVRRRRRGRVLFSDEILDRVMENQTRVEVQTVADRVDALARCLEQLPEHDRRLVECCYDGQCKIKEVAQREGRTAEAIYATLYRIRRALLKCIEHRLRSEVQP